MTAPATEPASPAPTPPASVQPAEPPAPPVEPEPETAEQKIERLEAAVKAANAEAAKTRTTAKQNAADEARKELAQAVGKALGLVTDEPIDPVKLTEQATASAAEAKQAKLELAVFHAAAANGADATALLDSRTFMTRLADVDPSDTAALTAVIGEAVKGNPAFAQTTAPRVPKPNPANGSSASGTPDAQALIEEAKAKGDWKSVIALENQKLLQPPR